MWDHISESVVRSASFQAAYRYIQKTTIPDGDNRRIACTFDGVVAISGAKRIEPERRRAEPDNKDFRAVNFAEGRYEVDLSSPDMIGRFDQIIRKYQVAKSESWEIENCAEVSLWMTLEALQARTEGPGHAARHLHTHRKNQRIWVFRIDRKDRPKVDAPCKTCRQWARHEFLTINGANWH